MQVIFQYQIKLKKLRLININPFSSCRISQFFTAKLQGTYPWDSENSEPAVEHGIVGDRELGFTGKRG